MINNAAMLENVFIGLGSNLAQPFVQVKQALAALSRLPETRLLSDSGYFKSKPMGPQDQPDYVNAVAWLETSLEPVVLLNYLQGVEKRQGRVRKQHWGARTIDLDILLYGGRIINQPRLKIPHQGICERDFVYLPLLKLLPDITVPGYGKLKNVVQERGELNPQTVYEANYFGPVM